MKKGWDGIAWICCLKKQRKSVVSNKLCIVRKINEHNHIRTVVRQPWNKIIMYENVINTRSEIHVFFWNFHAHGSNFISVGTKRVWIRKNSLKQNESVRFFTFQSIGRKIHWIFCFHCHVEYVCWRNRTFGDDGDAEADYDDDDDQPSNQHFIRTLCCYFEPIAASNPVQMLSIQNYRTLSNFRHLIAWSFASTSTKKLRTDFHCVH